MTVRVRCLLPGLILLITAPGAVLAVGVATSSTDSLRAAPGDVYAPKSSSVDEVELWSFPFDELMDVVDRQPGVVDGHLRGGRASETAYYYGRIPINNVFYSRSALEIEPGMLSGVRVRPGIVDSRFGYGMSGVVMMDPIAAPDTWTARLTARAGAFASGREMEFLQREFDASALDLADFEVGRVRYSDAVSLPAVGDIQLRTGGPVLDDRARLLVNARYRSTAGHMLGRRLFTPEDGIVAFSGRPRNEWIVRSTGDETFVQMGGEDRLTLSARALVEIMPGLDASYEAIVQNADLRPYDHTQKYVPDGAARQQNAAQLHIAEVTYGEGSDTRAWGHYAFLSDQRRVRLYDDPTDPRYAVQGPGNGANAFDAGGNDLARTTTSVRTHMASITAAHRFLDVQEVRAGVEARIHSIERDESRVEVLPGGEVRLSVDPIYNNRLDVTPSELAAFVGATIHIDRFTVDAGLRSAYFDPAAEIPIDWEQATELFIPNFEGSFYYDPEEGDTIRNRQDAPIQSWLSPRVELSFPVGEQTRIWFGGGRLYQMPALQMLYTNLDYERGVGMYAASSTLLANPSLEPERTLHMEMGVEHRLSDILDLEVALFGKDVKNLTSYSFERGFTTGDLVIRPINFSVAQVRGTTVSLLAHQNTDAKLSWTLDYSLLFVEGSESSTRESLDRFVSRLDNADTQVRLDWDRRHVIHNSIVWRPSERLTFTLLNRLQSPLPYKLAITNRPEYVVSGDDTPVQLLSDVRVWYDVPFGGESVRLFAQVNNLTDARVSRSVLSSTGTAADLFEGGRHLLLDEEVEGVNTIQEYADDRFYLPPRTVSLGVSVVL